MSDLVLLALTTIIPFSLIGFVTYKMLTRKKRPKLKLVEQPLVDNEQTIKEVIATVKKIDKNKTRRGKRRVKKS